MKVALHSTIVAGGIDDYRSEHLTIPDDLVETFERVGIHNWTIWRSGDRLFHLVDCDDFDAALRALDDDAANQRWQAQIGPFVEMFRTADGAEGMAPLELVWDLATQKR